ncbi:MAG: hypothetical protein KAS30_06065, partial [Candidatus Diapherotrites archaeon]|nr:hypothetical protein [Candidatus Diapherotrites archaeon]
YWGNSSLTEPANDSTYGSQAVWDSNYNMVQLMNTVANSNIFDSTSNGINSISANNFESDDGINGNYDGGVVADGINEYYGFGDVLDLNDMDYTIEMRLKGFEWSSNLETILSKWCDGTNAEWDFSTRSDGVGGTRLLFNWRDQSNTNNYLFSNNMFDIAVEHTVHITYDGITHRMFVDGVEHDSHVATAIRQGNNAELRLFRYVHTSLNYFGAGTIYQVRISQNKYRNSDWALTTHNNLNNPTVTGTTPFYSSFGAVEEPLSSDSPVVTLVSFDPVSPESGQIVTAIVTATDPQDDIDSYSFTVKNPSGSVFEGPITQASNVYSFVPNVAGYWTVEVTAADVNENESGVFSEQLFLSEWWNSNWGYRKSIILTENSDSDLIGYSVLVEFDSSSLISSGTMNSDCS